MHFLFAPCSYKVCFLSPGLEVFIVFMVRNADCFLGLVTTVSGCCNKQALKTYGSKSVGIILLPVTAQDGSACLGIRQLACIRGSEARLRSSYGSARPILMFTGLGQEYTRRPLLGLSALANENTGWWVKLQLLINNGYYFSINMSCAIFGTHPPTKKILFL